MPTALASTVRRLLAAGHLAPAVQLVGGEAALPALLRPTWVLGCGRSGTTALGAMIEAHPGVTYLHEATPVWNLDPGNRLLGPVATGRLLRDDPADARALGAVRRGFRTLLAAEGGAPLVEKQPHNAFRVPYLEQLAPDSRYLWVVRDPYETAASIARAIDKGVWGLPRKQADLRALGRLRGLSGRALAAAAADPFRSGLLEWRLSNATALATLPTDRTLRVDYADFLADPAATARAVAGWLALDDPHPLIDFATARIQRIHAPPTHRPTGLDHELLGDVPERLGLWVAG